MRGDRNTLGLAALLALSACGVAQSDVVERDDRIEALESQLSAANEKIESYEAATSELRSEVDTLSTATDGLESQVGRLDAENWEDVVGDLRGAKDDVVFAKDQVVTSVEELEGVD